MLRSKNQVISEDNIKMDFKENGTENGVAFL